MRICRAKLASLVGADSDHADMDATSIKGCPSIHDYQSATLVAWYTTKTWAHDGFAQFAKSNSSRRQQVDVGHGIPDTKNGESFQKAPV